MYIHQCKLLHVHASRHYDRGVIICHNSPSPISLWTTPTRGNEDVAALLVERALGAGARRYFRCSERSFPLAHSGKYFSVSHSLSLTAVVVADVPIGVDVEERLTSQACVDLAWAWSPGERAELQCQADVEHISTEIWTAKEAAGKALGMGLQALPCAIETSPVVEATAHRTIVMPCGRGTSTYLDSHGVWHGKSHLRISWRHAL
ncbi:MULTISPECIES: 4'-phosphopantetheinyl transferase family protein [Auritidibacter]|uniref:4'-phosphopantetheinyl transferase family protein n=1 Tax=Auritidibacter TaxID=1160973 RepID=UPI000D728CE6|nr:hypothetical protein DCC27_009365 [Auritidibacter sp. NML130574]NIH72730.1 hypothetical protein [Auritidibacter ignavus]PXA79501.1 hypothetical protein DCC26_05405 [Auritidibacter sp. NML120779]PXA80702.1 hypothetical protein DCC25_05675 [Auritidibacter sp. NML120636]RMX23454.1 4'-phosphopantetheinyl transferase superfamily protein [Auritidibacter ignavus]